MADLVGEVKIFGIRARIRYPVLLLFAFPFWPVPFVAKNRHPKKMSCLRQMDRKVMLSVPQEPYVDFHVVIRHRLAVVAVVLV